MAEQNPPTEAEQKPKRKLPLKTILIILGVLALEGGTIVGFKMFSKPSPAAGSDAIEGTIETPAREEVEINLAEDFSVDNHVGFKTNDKLVITMDVSIKVKKDLAEKVQTIVDENTAEIKDSIRTLVAAAKPEHIKEPDLQVIKREMKIAVEKIIGADMVEAVLIAEWKKFGGM